MGKSFGPGKDPDLDIVRSADASASELQRIAATRPDLLADIAAHPNAYPDLLDWLAGNPDPAVQEALARRGWTSGWQQKPVHHPAYHHGSAGPAGASPSPQGSTSPQKGSHDKRKWLLGIGAGLVLVLAVTGGFFGARFLSGSDFDRAPSQKAAFDLADVGRNAQLAQLQADDDADADQQLVRVVGPRQSVIMALHEETLQPAWMAPVPHADVKAPEADDAIDDGEGAEDDSADDGAKSTGPKLEGTPVDCQWSADSVTCGDRSIRLKDGAVTFSPGDGANGSKSDGPSADSEDGDTDVAEVKDPATEAVPITVNDDGSLKTPSGGTYSDVSVDAEATVRMVGAGDDGPWVVSDGQAVIAVDADSVLWKSELNKKAATASGLGEPRLRPNWTIKDDVLVIADDAGVHGLAVDSGQELWRVEVELDSFTVSGDHLLVMSDGVLEVFDFTDSSDVDTVKADPGYNGGSDGGAVAQFPGADAFKNAKLSTPPGCVEFGLAYDDYYLGDGPLDPKPEHEVEFTDGEASGDDGHYSGITMEGFTTSRMGDKALTAVEFSCNGGGTYIYPSIGIYDEDLKLLDSVELWDDVEDRGNAADISGYVPKPYFNSVSPMGQYLGIDVGGIGVYGDEGCTACGKSASADILYRWDGKSFAHQDTVYHVPSGDVRTPELEQVQKFAEAVAAGDDTEAERSATPEMMSSLDDILGDGQMSNPPTVRSEHFPKGVKVDYCELIQPYDDADYGGGEYFFANGKSMSYLSSQDEIRPGDTVCGVTTPQTGSGDQYYFYLLLRGTPDGSVKVYEAGRQFG